MTVASGQWNLGACDMPYFLAWPINPSTCILRVFSFFPGLIQKSRTALEAMCWGQQSHKMEGGCVSESLLEGELPAAEGSHLAPDMDKQ